MLLLSNVSAQEANTALKDFKISLEMQDDEVIMHCTEGCAWVNLTYKKLNATQAINEFGMTTITEDDSKTNVPLSHFLFTITKSKEELRLKGIDGTAWKELSFRLKDGQKQLINQFGMVDE